MIIIFSKKISDRNNESDGITRKEFDIAFDKMIKLAIE